MPAAIKVKRFEKPGVRGWLHEPAVAPTAAIIIAHGAGGDCEAPLMVATAEAFAEAGYLALRYDLPYRQLRPKGSPSSAQARDREGIRQTADAVRALGKKLPLYLAGHSYGGRQSTMLAAEDPEVGAALMLLSYPLHPPGQPNKMRTEHFPSLKVPALFVHGTRDDFGSVEELTNAIKLIASRTRVIPVPGGKHGLPPTSAKIFPEWFHQFLTAKS